MNFVEQVQNYNFASNSSSFVDIGLGFCVLLSLVSQFPTDSSQYFPLIMTIIANVQNELCWTSSELQFYFKFVQFCWYWARVLSIIKFGLLRGRVAPFGEASAAQLI